jgi:anti-anti-sigma factor
VWLRGEHDIATRVSLAVTLARAAQLDDVSLLVDLSAVTFMDASTVGVLVASRNRLRTRARTLRVRAPSVRALRVLEFCGLRHLVQREPLDAHTSITLRPHTST